MPLPRPAPLAALIVLLAGCDALPLDAPPTAEAAATSSITLCVPAGDAYAPWVVARREAGARLASGARLAGGSAFDAACRPRVTRVPCPCFGSTELARPIAGAVPTPFLYFDALDWYGEDLRRTEIRSVRPVPGGAAHELAVVYLTTMPDSSVAPYCHFAGYREGPTPGSMLFVTRTREITIAEAEVCRRSISAYAGDFPCQGPACGLPYTPADIRQPGPAGAWAQR